MANAEHLEILKSGVEKWNEWRKENNEVSPDLSDADLRFIGVNLSRPNFSKTNLSGANLYQINLHQASLLGANLSSSNLNQTDLSFANMTDADLSTAKLWSSDLHGCYLKGGNLANAELINANLTKANLTNANLNGADLSGANLSRALLAEADFNNCEIGGTIFSLTDLNACLGLDTVEAKNPCTIDFQTLRASKNLPKSFLLKIGLPELYIDYLPDFYGDALNFYPAFLSHSWKNKDFARKLYEALIAKGVNVFFDEKKMKPGDDIYESISKGISLYDKMILVCSKESLSESWWVDRELDRILKKERDLFKERSQRINLLIPITLDDFVFSWDGAKAEEVRRYVVGDFRDWQDETKFEKALNDLIHALNADRPDVKPKSLL